MTSDTINTALRAGTPLSEIGGTLYCTFFTRNYDCVASIWSFDDDDFSALVRNGVFSEDDWYSTPLDCVHAYLGIPYCDSDGD